MEDASHLQNQGTRLIENKDNLHLAKRADHIRYLDLLLVC